MKLLALASLLLSANAAAAGVPQIPSQKMTCDQAVAFYNKHKKIYTISHGKDLVPIYGIKPMSQDRTYDCGPRKARTYYPVKTLDNARCYIGVYCNG